MPSDPTQITAPLAAPMKWKPARFGSNSFRTHDLIEIPPHRVELRAAGRPRRICRGLVFGGGVILVAFVLYAVLRGLSALSMEAFAVPVAGVTFIAIGWGMMRLEMKPMVFDVRTGWYWKGKAEAEPTQSWRPPKDAARIADIRALQLLSKRFSGAYASFKCYELNLVLTDGRRLNVLNHGDLSAIRSQAAAISKLIAKPVWDAVDEAAQR
jgi:hypothetical protein